MSTETVQLFLALLAVLAAAGTVYVLVNWAMGRREVLDQLSSTAVLIAWLVATTSTVGSLYLSEVAGYDPCRLCWYQRYAMYPLILVLGYALLRRNRIATIVGLAMAGIGAAIAGYHVALQRLPDLDVGSCSATNPCTGRWMEELGFITIPTMALVGFIAIGVLLTLRLRFDAEVAT